MPLLWSKFGQAAAPKLCARKNPIHRFHQHFPGVTIHYERYIASFPIYRKIYNLFETLQTYTQSHRYFSSTENCFTPKSPSVLSSDICEGILSTTQFYIRFGISHQRLQALSTEPGLHLSVKWQKMMEIYLQTQAHVIAGLGYQANEEGLTLYAHQLGQLLQKLDPTLRQLFTDLRRDTWRQVVATTFQINMKDIPVLEIGDARSIMHKISTKMQDPDILLVIQNKTAKIQNEEKQFEMAEKHTVMQNALVDLVYLGGSPSLVELAGFGSGETGYAKLQCCMTDHEGDPVLSEYSAAAMLKILDAAGIDFNDLVDEANSESS